ncbi:hypothetical protein ST37_17015 [Vibrio sp. qd031]|uniref:fumarylacetoacetate hydrolase family protein n=1 Tax=Vibrio sp. qd031 TaxID=1603038 RepID=UPI000A0F66F2|nr:fumarylacetoacetate hydrolase family protein [Vibrio sp. qd031]ORT48768.1 hypothetical protein ST37_17015 [Vibrio sp. qd031]
MNHVVVNHSHVSPSKILCVGRNYYAHIEELNNDIPDSMVLFAKFNSSISDQLHSFDQEPLHYEGELCFIAKDGVLSAVGFGFDLTKRGLQSQLKAKGLPWERAKAFDGSAVFSEFVDIDSLDHHFRFEVKINNSVIQRGDSNLMIHSPIQIAEEISQFSTLQDGDIVMTGTPKGVGEVKAGDRFSAKVWVDDTLIIEQQWLAQ